LPVILGSIFLLTLAVRTPNVLVANPDFPVGSVRELIEHAGRP